MSAEGSSGLGFKPQPGQIVRYWYTWEKDKPPTKPHPCVILDVKPESGADKLVLAAITHTQPDTPRDGIPLTKKSQARMGLDERQQWVITNNINVARTDSDDFVKLEKSNPPTCLYGVMPLKIGQAVKKQITRNRDLGRLMQVKRDKGNNQEKDQGLER